MSSRDGVEDGDIQKHAVVPRSGVNRREILKYLMRRPGGGKRVVEIGCLSPINPVANRPGTRFSNPGKDCWDQ